MARKTVTYRPEPPEHPEDNVAIREVALTVGDTEVSRIQFKPEDTQVNLGSFEVAQGQNVVLSVRDGDDATPTNWSGYMEVYRGTPIKDTTAPSVPLPGKVEFGDEEVPAPTPAE